MIKYSCVMPINRYNRFTKIAMDSVITAIGKREDVEFIVLDDSNTTIPHYDNVQYVQLPKIDLVNKLIIGTQLAKGEYYCNVDYDDLSHPQKFELFDKLLKYNDIAGANNCVFYDVKTNKTYKLKDELLVRKHLYRNEAIEYPFIQHSNSAIPLKWLREVGYGNGKRVNMAHSEGHVMTDSPIWAKATIDGMKFGLIEDWKNCWQIITDTNVNNYTKEQWKIGFDEVEVKRPKGLL